MMNAAACPSTHLVPWARRVMNSVRFAPPFLGAINKPFFHRKGFITTDQGNHVGRVDADDICDKASATQLEDLKKRGITKMDKFCFHETRLALVHYRHLALTFCSYKAKIQRGFEPITKLWEKAGGSIIARSGTRLQRMKIQDARSLKIKHVRVGCMKAHS